MTKSFTFSKPDFFTNPTTLPTNIKNMIDQSNTTVLVCNTDDVNTSFRFFKDHTIETLLGFAIIPIQYCKLNKNDLDAIMHHFSFYVQKNKDWISTIIDNYTDNNPDNLKKSLTREKNSDQLHILALIGYRMIRYNMNPYCTCK